MEDVLPKETMTKLETALLGELWTHPHWLESLYQHLRHVAPANEARDISSLTLEELTPLVVSFVRNNVPEDVKSRMDERIREALRNAAPTIPRR